MNLKDKVAIVTGAGQGIGSAIALRLSDYGARIAVWDLNPETAAATAKEIAGAKSYEVDVSNIDRVQDAAAKVEADFGQIDILVNNAGWDIIQPFLDTTPDFWDKVIAINLKGPINCAKTVIDRMIERNSGKIINIASDAGRVGSLGETVYAGAKGGVIAFTKSLAREVARYKINVNCVCPGPTNTTLYKAQTEKVRQALERAIPFRRVAEPEEIANAVVFFASGLSDYITGQILSVSGGLTMVG